MNTKVLPVCCLRQQQQRCLNQKKRLKLSFDAQHLRIPKYTHPTEMTTEMRIYNVIKLSS